MMTQSTADDELERKIQFAMNDDRATTPRQRVILLAVAFGDTDLDVDAIGRRYGRTSRTVRKHVKLLRATGALDGITL